MNLTTIWLIILVVCIVVELITMGLTTIWFAGGALIAAIAAALSLPLWLQILLFLAVSLALLYLTRPVAVKYFNKDRVKTNAESLVGQQAIVISEIDNLQGIGQVTVGRQEWSARSTDDNKKLPVGSVVIIRAISGVKLIVEEKEMPLTGKEKLKERRGNDYARCFTCTFCNFSDYFGVLYQDRTPGLCLCGGETWRLSGNLVCWSSH